MVGVAGAWEGGWYHPRVGCEAAGVGVLIVVLSGRGHGDGAVLLLGDGEVKAGAEGAAVVGLGEAWGIGDDGCWGGCFGAGRSSGGRFGRRVWVGGEGAEGAISGCSVLRRAAAEFSSERIGGTRPGRGNCGTMTPTTSRFCRVGSGGSNRCL